ncbi:MAG: TetR/AcrR family transcriptional regulator [Acidimicrobiales bacterium]
MSPPPEPPAAPPREPAPVEPRTDEPLDGRTARAVRTRAAIVDALLQLLDEGDLQPTATRIADRAGISLRLIYHHYGDLESLFRAAAERQAERLADLAEDIPADLPAAERLTRFVDQRTAMLEWITPVRRAALLQEPFSEQLQAARDALMAIAEQQVAEVFAPELEAADDRAVAHAVTAVASWGFWNDLRTVGRTTAEAQAAVAAALAALLGITR